MFTCLLYSFSKAAFSEAGYPEKVATATGSLKLDFDKKKVKTMSFILKSLVANRNKGYVGLLNGGQPTQTRF